MPGLAGGFLRGLGRGRFGALGSGPDQHIYAVQVMLVTAESYLNALELELRKPRPHIAVIELHNAINAVVSASAQLADAEDDVRVRDLRAQVYQAQDRLNAIERQLRIEVR